MIYNVPDTELEIYSEEHKIKHRFQPFMMCYPSLRWTFSKIETYKLPSRLKDTF